MYYNDVSIEEKTIDLADELFDEWHTETDYEHILCLLNQYKYQVIEDYRLKNKIY